MILDAQGNPYNTSASTPTAAYEGASSGRRLSTWGLDSGSANALDMGSLGSLRSRSRTMVRNNPIAASGVNSFVSNLVGTDISPVWNGDSISDEKKKELTDLWNDSQQELDSAGVYDFYGQIEQVALAMIDSGEALARFRPRRMVDNLIVPLQIQLLEGDHLDVTYNTLAPNGNEIRMGIEWDKIGRRAAYWLFREHPGEGFTGLSGRTGERTRVPASEVLHIYRPLRIGQARGCPWLAPLIVKLKAFDGYDDAELIRKKTAALFAGVIQNVAPTENGVPSFGTPGTTTNNVPTAGLEPGAMIKLGFNETIEFSKPADVGGSYREFMRHNMHVIAKGLGITYEQLTGDLSEVNYSSIRAGLIEFRRYCEMIQVRTLIHQFCRPVIRRWMSWAALSKAIDLPGYFENPRPWWRVTWHADGWDYVDPVKDRIAEQMDVRSGFDSRKAIIARRGGNVETVDAEIESDNKRADDKKLVYDTDPRHITKSGIVQSAENMVFSEALQTDDNNGADKTTTKED